MNRSYTWILALLLPFASKAQSSVDTLKISVAGGDTVLQEFDQDIPTISIDESDGKESGGDNVSSSLNASRDAF